MKKTSSRAASLPRRKNNFLKKGAGLFLLPLFFLFTSCFGVNLDITLNKNGSGTVTLEYRVSKSLDALGKQDGNERWNTIPVGRADFERSLDRLPDMKLLSFSSKEDEKNLIINAKMEFGNIRGLLAFLDASGERSSFTPGEAGAGRLAFTLSEGAKRDAALDKLIANAAESYMVKLGMTFPGEGSLALLDNEGKSSPAIPGSEVQNSGKKVSCAIPLYEVLSSSGGITVEFRW